jgi:hypothetical protein
MSDVSPALDAELAARLERLPRSIEPPTDLWPALAARIACERAELDALSARAPRDVAPEVDLWPDIEAALEGPRRIAASPRAAPIQSRWAAAASVASIAILAGLASYSFLGDVHEASPYTSRLRQPAGGPVSWLASGASLPGGGAVDEAIEAIRIDLAIVQSERRAIERSLSRDAGNLTLHALWRHTYRAELDLAAQAERLIETYQGV